MTSLTCPPFGSEIDDSTLFMSVRDYNKKISDKVFNYYRCRRSGFIFLDPIPADLGKYYPSDYYDVPASEAELVASAEVLQQWKLDAVLAHAKGGRLLEIGAAYGLFSFLAKRAGFKVTAIEMDARCCGFLRDVVGIDVVESDDALSVLETLPEFDVIVMWQVLEHLPDPWTVLAAVAERLVPNGVLILDTPNPDAFQFRVLGRRWVHLDAPRHVALIPVELLTDYVGRHGLEAERLTAADAGANGFNGYGWAFTFKNFLGDNLFGRIGFFLGRVLAKLLIPIERTGWRGSTYTAVFRKRA